MIFSSKYVVRRHLGLLLASILPLANWVLGFPVALFFMPPQSSWQQRGHVLQEKSNDLRYSWRTSTLSTRAPYPSSDIEESTITSTIRGWRTKSTRPSAHETSSWIPRLAFYFVYQFRHHLECNMTTSLQPPVSLSPHLDVVVEDTVPLDMTEKVAGSARDPPRPPSPSTSIGREDAAEVSERETRRFFPVPEANAVVYPYDSLGPNQQDPKQAMWNLTQDLLNNETENGHNHDDMKNNLDGIQESRQEDIINTIQYSSKGGTIIEAYGTTSTGCMDSISSELEPRSNSWMSVDIDKEDLKRRAAEISHSFYAKKFQPAWFAKNPHLQTIVGGKARQESMYFPTTGNLVLSNFKWDIRKRVETPDGDFFDVDWKYVEAPSSTTGGNLLATTDNDDDASNTSSTTSPLVLICHGLQSNTDSPLIKDMAIAFNLVGMDVAAINFRGCSGEPNRTPMGYHLSFTDDLELMVKQISTQQPGRPIFLSGVSLGANVVTNFLANIGTKAVTRYNIWGAAVNAVPFDLTKTQAVNEPGFAGALYGNLLFKSLQDRVLESMERIKYNFTKEELEKCTNCKEFDDLVVCSVYEQFENANDYHRKSSTYNRLHEIMVPHFIVQALDDPFFIGNTNPKNDPTLPCRIEYTKHGGHCGFVFHSEERDKRNSSFMPTELARYLEHVYKARTGKKSTSIALRKQQPHPIATEIITTSKSLRRKMAATAAHDFATREFVPAEWAKNEHLQTIMGALFRRQTMYIKKKAGTPVLMSLLESLLASYEFRWDERERMSTPDGDFFDVDWKYVRSRKDEDGLSEERPVVLICHGLQSDSSSPLAQDMAIAFNEVGMDAACINFRGCSGEINRTPVGYHLGFTEDLQQMIGYINKTYPRRRIYLSGFSLGSAVVTTCLAELGERAYDYNIFGAAVNAVPFDMPKAQKNLNQDGLTKSLYGGRLLASMIDRVEASYDHIEFYFPREEARKCKNIMDMENLVIAPIFGFKDAYDYYHKTSILLKHDKVAVPELVIQAKDDPFFTGQSLPVDDPSRPLRVVVTDHGGHSGYVFHSLKEESYKTSWMPMELARFLAHLEESFSSKIV